MDLKPTAEHQPTIGRDARALRIRIIPFQEESAGVLFGRTLKPEGLNELLVSRLEHRSRRDLRVVASLDNNKAPLEPATADLTIAVVKAYVQTMHDTKTGVVVLRVEYAGKIRYFRGQDTGLNWWGSGTEMAAALGQALEQALTQLQPLLDSVSNTPERAQSR
jgi:hypothetical protein